MVAESLDTSHPAPYLVPMITGRTVFRAFLVISAGFVLWWLGHVLLESIWTLFQLPPDSSVPRVANLVLVPVAFAVAWIGLRWSERRDAETGGSTR